MQSFIIMAIAIMSLIYFAALTIIGFLGIQLYTGTIIAVAIAILALFSGLYVFFMAGAYYWLTTQLDLPWWAALIMVLPGLHVMYLTWQKLRLHLERHRHLR